MHASVQTFFVGARAKQLWFGCQKRSKRLVQLRLHYIKFCFQQNKFTTGWSCKGSIAGDDAGKEESRHTKEQHIITAERGKQDQDPVGSVATALTLYGRLEQGARRCTRRIGARPLDGLRYVCLAVAGCVWPWLWIHVSAFVVVCVGLSVRAGLSVCICVCVSLSMPVRWPAARECVQATTSHHPPPHHGLAFLKTCACNALETVNSLTRCNAAIR